MSRPLTKHTWREAINGRSLVSLPTGMSAVLECGLCKHRTMRTMQKSFPPDPLDKWFRTAGWSLDPPVCPTCVARKKQERTRLMSSTAPKPILHSIDSTGVVPAAPPQAIPSDKGMMATAKVFTLLTAHFDVGRFINGYSDKRIAAETGIAVSAVVTLRRECFGELKEDPAIADLRGEIKALEDLIADEVTTFRAQLAELRAKLEKLL